MEAVHNVNFYFFNEKCIILKQNLFFIIEYNKNLTEKNNTITQMIKNNFNYNKCK